MDKTVYEVLEDIQVDARRSVEHYAADIEALGECKKPGDEWMKEMAHRQKAMFLQRAIVMKAIIRELPAEVLERIAE